jgi:hypothetical protein
MSWTPADKAELDVLIWGFVDGFYGHRERCPVCNQHGPWCENAREAFDVLLDWLQLRRLLSKAEWLRKQEAA